MVHWMAEGQNAYQPSPKGWVWWRMRSRAESPPHNRAHASGRWPLMHFTFPTQCVALGWYAIEPSALRRILRGRNRGIQVRRSPEVRTVRLGAVETARLPPESKERCDLRVAAVTPFDRRLPRFEPSPPKFEMLPTVRTGLLTVHPGSPAVCTAQISVHPGGLTVHPCEISVHPAPLAVHPGELSVHTGRISRAEMHISAHPASILPPHATRTASRGAHRHHIHRRSDHAFMDSRTRSS